MKIVTFDYLKSDETVPTHRTVLTQDVLNPNIRGIDLSALSDEEREVFMIEYDEIFNEYYGQLNDLLEEFHLNDRYRQYKREGVSNFKQII